MTNTINLNMPSRDLSNRKINPFSPAKIHNALEQARNKNLYEDLVIRTKIKNPTDKKLINESIDSLRNRISNTVFTSENFGEIKTIKFELLDINVDNQRDVDWAHVAHIIEHFDPRAVQVVNVIALPNGRYSIPEGQHTAVSLYILHSAGLISKDFEVQCKVINALETVPGNNLKGEAFGNWLFRLINYKGRKAVEPYFMHRSRVSGVRNYNSTLIEDIHAEKIEAVVEKNNMYTQPAIAARGFGARPGMVTYINGLNRIAELESENFDTAINDLDFALSLHNRYFANERGVDGGFILAFGRYAKFARQSNITITREWQDELMKFFKETYATPSKFHSTCKRRLAKFNNDNNLPGGWSDNCLSSILILDFYRWCDRNNVNYPMLNDKNINKYHGI